MLFDPLPRAILLDVGFTLTFCDGRAIASHAARAGVIVDPLAIEGAEGALRAELRETLGTVHRTHDDGGKRYLGRIFRRTLELAGQAGPPDSLQRAVEIVLGEHLRRNVWCRVGAGVPTSLQRLRAAGCRLAVVSNSEGTVEAMLETVGLRPLLDTVVDSAVVGLVKPDPRIFQVALDRLGIASSQAVMVGDSPSADVVGARAVGARAALLDPFDLYLSVDAPRFRDLAAFTDALLGTD
ncbi:MAG TPA: HAD family hydrolase [Polyangia bacterium]|jgi:putative hydrolase of the HAD superfamily|nr:HAD family hydrolase [Polyangia bacterium]